ncbi:MAG TPA: ribosome recycling factor [Myxococcota bacterium]|nr:ribosome recycling factor [Myxococcota bacterium]HOD08388.1 ribosome recycling factor [Myxococcota bacterium]HPB49776.1 ribosome recycling factor [Myxococcota bacterium]HQP94776.1 ribosome recycling factor [Myxococcota bacterium]
MTQKVFENLENAFASAIANYERDLSRVRTGRANLALLEGLKVEYYGVPTPLSQVAALSVPDPRMIVVKPWDKKLISYIEKAVINADLGLSPSNDGDVVRLPIPPLTTERRKELVKQVKKMSEETKISVRNARRDGRAELDKVENLPEDEKKRAQEKVDKETEKYVKMIDEIAVKKEKEIMDF